MAPFFNPQLPSVFGETKHSFPYDECIADPVCRTMPDLRPAYSEPFKQLFCNPDLIRRRNKLQGNRFLNRKTANDFIQHKVGLLKLFGSAGEVLQQQHCPPGIFGVGEFPIYHQTNMFEEGNQERMKQDEAGIRDMDIFLCQTSNQLSFRLGQSLMRQFHRFNSRFIRIRFPIGYGHFDWEGVGKCPGHGNGPGLIQ